MNPEMNSLERRGVVMKRVSWLLACLLIVSLYALPGAAQVSPSLEDFTLGDDLNHLSYGIDAMSISRQNNAVTAQVTAALIRLRKTVIEQSGADTLTIRAINKNDRSAVKSSVTFDATSPATLADMVKTVAVDMDIGKFEMDRTLLMQLAGAGQAVTISSERVSTDAIEAQGLDPTMTVFELSIKKADGSDLSFGGGKVKVTLPWNGNTVPTSVGYMNSSGGITQISGFTVDEANKTVSFVTNHFSTWVLYTDDADTAGSGVSATMMVGIGLCAAALAGFGVSALRRRRGA